MIGKMESKQQDIQEHQMNNTEQENKILNSWRTKALDTKW